LPRGTG
jgi:hypothetical protein